MKRKCLFLILSLFIASSQLLFTLPVESANLNTVHLSHFPAQDTPPTPPLPGDGEGKEPSRQLRIGVMRHQGGTTDPPPGVHDFPPNTSIKITAIPDKGWELDKWVFSGADRKVWNSCDQPLYLTMDSHYIVTAYFKPEVKSQYTLTIEVDGNGRTFPSPGTYTYDRGEIVEDIFALADTGWEFDYWSGDVTGEKQYDVTIAMDSDKTIVAHFRPKQGTATEEQSTSVPSEQEPQDESYQTSTDTYYTLTMNVDGGGTTEPSPAYTYKHKSGTSIPIKAIPDPGWEFDHWEIDGTGVKPDIMGASGPEVIMSGDRNVTAHFKQPLSWIDRLFGAKNKPQPAQTQSTIYYTLSIKVVGRGTTKPAPGDYRMPLGQQVKITAHPKWFAKFDGWSGAVKGTAREITVSMYGDQHVTANFK